MKCHVLAVGLFAVLSCSQVNAQTVNLAVKIPFNFRVGATAMPAGNYRFHESQHILTVSQVGGARSVSIMTLPTSPKGELSKGVVEFNRYGDTYFLSGLWSPESAEGSAVIKGRQEKEIARRFGSAPAQTAALKTK